MLLGSASLDDLLDRVDTVNRVSDQDARVINEVRIFRAEIKEREAKLTMARAEQERLVAERAAKRDQIRSQLAERQQLLSSIKDQIAKIQAAERAQQQRLANQAETRISNDSGGNPAGHHAADDRFGRAWNTGRPCLLAADRRGACRARCHPDV